MASASQKRHRFQGDLLDPDSTPRPSSASVSNSQISSGQLSIKAQLNNLEVNGTMECISLSSKTVPPAAKSFFETMEEIEDGTASFISGDKPDNLPGRIPPVSDLEYMRDRTDECNNDQEESAWNSLVHIPLLRLIFENELRKRSGEFTAVNLTKARPHVDFKPPKTPGKMIDLGIYAVFDQNPELRAALEAFAKTTPTKTVNHTDHSGIRHYPLQISIETKQNGEGFNESKLQMGVWHATQWAFLRWGVRRKLQQQCLDQQLDLPTDDFEAETLEVLSKLRFIPGIFIDGQNWSYVFSTYTNGKTTLYTGSKFGRTGSVNMMYRVVAGVRQLTAWARDEYLPWFKVNVLTLKS
ncbi:hypothetical protein V8C35DRAFT_284899 [Trichoderma chlorosporum]